MSPIRREFEIAREYNNAASVIQRAWRGYLENKRGQRWSTQQAQQSSIFLLWKKCNKNVKIIYRLGEKEAIQITLGQVNRKTWLKQ